MKEINLKKAFANTFKIHKTEERPTPQIIYNWRIWVTAVVAATAGLVIGYDNGFVGGTLLLQAFRDEFGLDDMTPSHASFVTSNVVSTFHGGCFFGSFISYPMAHYYGRKKGLMTASVFILVGSIIMMISSTSRGLSPMYVGRIVAGLGAGMTTNIVPIYIAEVSPPSIRGQVSGMYELIWRVGDMCGFWINYGVSQNMRLSRAQWLIPFLMQLLPASLFLAGSLILKESPRWCLISNREEQGIQIMEWLRQLPRDDEYFEYELNKIKLSIEDQKNTIGLKLTSPMFQILRRKDLLERLFITCSLFLFQSFMGVQSLNYYSPRIFESLGVRGTNASLFSTGMFGVVKFVATQIWIAFIVDNVGRRRTLLVTSSLCSICFWYIGAYLKLDDPTNSASSSPSGGRAAIGLVYVWNFFFIIGWSGNPYVIGAEVFSLGYRAFTQAVNSCALWLGVFIMSRFTTNMIDSMSFGIYFFFASVAVLTVPFVYYLVPETKGVPLEDMDQLFARGLPAKDAHSFVMLQEKNTGLTIDDALLHMEDSDEGEKPTELYLEKAI